jgi:REP element-mobilizing transposase RayT
MDNTSEFLQPVKRRRLHGFHYHEGYAYFVTLCCARRTCLFGEIQEGSMRRNALAEMVLSCWANIPAHFPNVELDAFVIMPNHIHGVLCIPADPTTAQVAADHVRPLSGSLSIIVGSFKAAVTRSANRAGIAPKGAIWQRSFHDRIVRNDWELERIRVYIESNPIRWALDRENPAAEGVDPDWPWLSDEGQGNA